MFRERDIYKGPKTDWSSESSSPTNWATSHFQTWSDSPFAGCHIQAMHLLRSVLEESNLTEQWSWRVYSGG